MKVIFQGGWVHLRKNAPYCIKTIISDYIMAVQYPLIFFSSTSELVNT